MILAVHANTQPMFREGSALATCTEALRNLCTKIKEVFMKILQTMLPCVFGKSPTVVANVIQPPAPQPVPSVVAVQQQVLPAPPAQLPPAPVVAPPAVVAAPVVPLPAPAPVPPAVVAAPVAEPPGQHAAPPPGEQPAAPVPPAVVAAPVAEPPEQHAAPPLGEQPAAAVPPAEEPPAHVPAPPAPPAAVLPAEEPPAHVPAPPAPPAAVLPAEEPPAHVPAPPAPPAAVPPAEEPPAPAVVAAPPAPPPALVVPLAIVAPRAQVVPLPRQPLGILGGDLRDRVPAGTVDAVPGGDRTPRRRPVVQEFPGAAAPGAGRGRRPAEPQGEFKGAPVNFGQAMAEVHKLPQKDQGRAVLNAFRAAREARRVQAAAPAAHPQRDIRLIGQSGLNEEDGKAGPLICLDALLGCWDQILAPDGVIGDDVLDGYVKAGRASYAECVDQLDEGRVPIVDLVDSNRDARSVALRANEGTIQVVLGNLQAAKQDRALLGALVARRDETFGIFVRSDQFFVLDPYGYITLHTFENAEAVAAHFLRDRDKANEFVVLAFEKAVGQHDDIEDPHYVRGHGTLTREEALALAAAAAAERRRKEEEDNA